MTSTLPAQAASEVFANNLIGAPSENNPFELGYKPVKGSSLAGLQAATDNIGDKFKDQFLTEATIRQAIGAAYSSATLSCPATHPVNPNGMHRWHHCWTMCKSFSHCNPPLVLGQSERSIRPMQSATDNLGGATGGHASFPPTQWSVVAKAKQWDSADVDAALERLCTIYWNPLYAYIRRKGFDATESKDLTQEFIARFLEKKWLSRHVDRRAKFRSFLLTFLEHFLSDHRTHVNAQKRGGGKVVISLNAIETEERSIIEPSNGLAPDQLYDRSWVHVLLNLASDRLKEEYRSRKQERLFAELCQIPIGEHGERNYFEISTGLGMSEEAFKSAVFRYRIRWGELIREEIAGTVSDPDQVDEEVQALLQAFS